MEVVWTAPLSPYDTALLTFGEQVATSSIESIKDYAKTMVTVDTGLFATYFAILKFLGLAAATANIAMNAASLVPPALLILSIIALVFAIKPIQAEMSLELPDSIFDYRERTLTRKHKAMATGTVLFLLSLVAMAGLFLSLLV